MAEQTPSLADEVRSVLPLPKHALTLQYIKNRVIAALVRIPLLVLLTFSYYIKDNTLVLRFFHGVTRHRIRVPSRERGRFIDVDIYTPAGGLEATGSAPGSKKPTGPVHVNWHGSGFVLNCFGADAEMCSILASKLRCTVFDADYRKAPEHPYPAAVEDAEDVCLWVMAHPETYDVRNISVGGSSAGANLSLAAGVSLGERLCAVAAIAPPADFRIESGPRVAPEKHARALPPWASRYFDACYLITAADRSDPRLSPVCASLSKGHLATRGTVFIATGTGDTLYQGGRTCIDNLAKQGHKNAVFRPIPGEGHGFEKALGGPTRVTAMSVFDDIVGCVRASWTRGGQDIEAKKALDTSSLKE